MFIFMTALLMLIGVFVSWIFGARWIYGVGVMLALSIAFCVYSYYFSKNMALRANGAKIVTREEYPRLYDIVASVASKANLPMPEVGIVRTSMPNAFATGRNPENAAVCATTALLDLLPDDELEGVIAHEMAHVKNRDILVMSVASAFAIMITYISRIAVYLTLFADRDSKESGLIFLVALLFNMTVPIAAMLIQLGISRNREFLADASGAAITSNPRALARALNHLEKGDAVQMSYTIDDESRRSPAQDYDCAHMWISNPLKKAGLIKSMFSTHPPMEERIRRLNEMADEKGL